MKLLTKIDTDRALIDLVSHFGRESLGCGEYVFVRNFTAGESADVIASNFFVGTISLARHPTSYLRRQILRRLKSHGVTSNV
jgi:hypothetical protein